MTKTTKTNENANQVINKLSANDIINKFATNTKGLLQTNLGTKKSSIYLVEIFADCTDREKKSLRKKLRNMLFSCANSLINEKNKEKQKELIKAFNEFYRDCYACNDYTLPSVCNENLKADKKEILEKALNLCKQ